MHDAVSIEDAGVPAIALIHDVFEHAAQLQAEILGRPDLARVIYPQGKAEMSEEEIDALGRQALAKIVVILGAS